MIARELPRFCSWNTDQRGARFVRFRKGFVSLYIPGVPWSVEFMRAYHEALNNGEAAQLKLSKSSHTLPGSVDAVIVSFLASNDFHKLKESTKRVRRNMLERFREEHGKKSIKLLSRAHVKAIIGAMADRPSAANNLLKALRVLLKHAVDMELIGTNPAAGVTKYAATTEGFHSWSEADIAAYEARHSTGTRARLALSLLLYTGQRRSDVVRMGWQHVRGDLLSVLQDKTGRSLKLPIHPVLAAELTAAPRGNMTFLLTEAGAPFSAAGFGNWFRDRCNEAGLRHCSAHGLRKACATRLANAGCTTEQIKAITGHKTLSEVARYTAAADQERNARQAIAKQLSSEHEQTHVQQGMPAGQKVKK